MFTVRTDQVHTPPDFVAGVRPLLSVKLSRIGKHIKRVLVSLIISAEVEVAVHSKSCWQLGLSQLLR